MTATTVLVTNLKRLSLTGELLDNGLVHYPVVCLVERKMGDEVQCIPQLSLISRLTAVSRSAQVKQKCMLQNKHHFCTNSCCLLPTFDKCYCSTTTQGFNSS